MNSFGFWPAINGAVLLLWACWLELRIIRWKPTASLLADAELTRSNDPLRPNFATTVAREGYYLVVGLGLQLLVFFAALIFSEQARAWFYNAAASPVLGVPGGTVTLSVGFILLVTCGWAFCALSERERQRKVS